MPPLNRCHDFSIICFDVSRSTAIILLLKDTCWQDHMSLALSILILGHFYSLIEMQKRVLLFNYLREYAHKTLCSFFALNRVFHDGLELEKFIYEHELSVVGQDFSDSIRI